MNRFRPLRVLVVDDSIVFRMMVSDVINRIPGMEVVGTAHDGKSALSRTLSLKPDLLTLDIEMPGMDGLAVLTRIRSQFPKMGVIMLSSHTGRGGGRVIASLEMGAFDFILKPGERNMAENKIKLEKDLAPLLRSFSRILDIRSILGGQETTRTLNRRALPDLERQDPSAVSRQPSVVSRQPQTPDPAGRNRPAVQRPPAEINPKNRPLPDGIDPLPAAGLPPSAANPGHGNFSHTGLRRPLSDVVAIGVSTGGPAALARLIPDLPADFPVPVLIVQHMPPGFTGALAESLDRKSLLSVMEARNGDPLIAGRVYIAPGGSHMKVTTAGKQNHLVIGITRDPPENGCRPSADILFGSVAQHFRDRATGVIMTGMGQDGTKGLETMKQNGAFIIAQDEATSTIFGMAKQPIAAGIVDVVAPLDTLARAIAKTVRPAGRMIRP
jgi:two-component system, chemotaxis family, protein-glutamate methylesterase/glutaminase